MTNSPVARMLTSVSLTASSGSSVFAGSYPYFTKCFCSPQTKQIIGGSYSQAITKLNGAVFGTPAGEIVVTSEIACGPTRRQTRASLGSDPGSSAIWDGLVVIRSNLAFVLGGRDALRRRGSR